MMEVAAVSVGHQCVVDIVHQAFWSPVERCSRAAIRDGRSAAIQLESAPRGFSRKLLVQALAASISTTCLGCTLE